MDENDLWQYSLDVYDSTAAADACLALQDHFKANVNLLLYYTWIARRHGRTVDNELCARTERHIAPLVNDLLQPMRSIRRSIDKTSASPDLLQFRKNILNLELEAENIIQKRLFDLTPDLLDLTEPSDLSVRDRQKYNLAVYGEFLGTAFPDEHLEPFLDHC
ncbi:TIGR02444 family protein [Emcibacter sp.]|uniref:TIGR02444 family protein n=1 Tax=Emcibacter sp. TaxID=1979954 RepID=UPI003A8F394B